MLQISLTYELRHEKTCLRSFRLNWATTTDDLMLEILDSGRRGIVLCSENITAQLICAFVFRICRKQVFSQHGSYYIEENASI